MTGLADDLDGKRVVICAGSGGVGKTTVAAAVAVGLAEAGRRVAVVTIDPARRLAESLGLDALGNQPQPLDPAALAAAGLQSGCELSAMMLDVKRTLDELIGRLARDADGARAILANPVYQQLSTAIAGTQEYTAMVKLHELASDDRYEVIVLDTPPSRSAVDFLRAPERLVAFIEGPGLAAFLRPSRHLARYAGIALTVLRRITGVALLRELADFFGLLGEVIDGFQSRAAEVQRLLAQPSTSFLIVTSPDAAAVQETIHFARELEHTGLRRGGVVVNRVQPLDPSEADIATTTERLSSRLDMSLARKVARTHAELQYLARRDHESLSRLQTELPGTRPVCLADRETGVHELGGLRVLSRELFGEAT